MAVTKAQQPAVPSAPPLEVAAAAVMADLQQALRELLLALPDRVDRPVDLERCLNLDKKLAWQVVKLTQSSGFSDAAKVPSRRSCQRLIASATAKGVPRATIKRVGAAFDRFEAFATEHGGDRDEFTSLLAGLAGEPDEQHDLKVRQGLFRGNAYVWGTRVFVQTRTRVWSPMGVRNPGVALVMGDIGVQRLRGESSVHPLPAPDEPPGGAKARRPVLLGEFCTPSALDGAVETGRLVEPEMVAQPGRSGAVTMYAAQFQEPAASPGGARFDARMFIAAPAEGVVCDLLAPAGMTDPATARVAVYGNRSQPREAFEERAGDLLPQRETVRYLGVMDCAPALEGAPQHQESVRAVLRTRGWYGSRFDVYRCRVAFPVLHTLLVVRVDAARRA